MNIVNQIGLAFEPWYRSQSSGKLANEHIAGYEVKENGNLIGLIQPDRSLSHPDVRWKCSIFRNGKEEELPGEYGTSEEAKGAFWKLS
jgi:hypothetical protein